jgi:CTP synthase (UTP-ammonia lyase)
VDLGVIGDFRESNETHRATTDALQHAAASLAAPASVSWLGTEGLARHGAGALARFDGLVVAPGSPYASAAGAFAAIRYARERDVPLLGTCGGFQHVVIEFARAVAGIDDAAHAETDPDASCLLISALSCSLAGQSFEVEIAAGTRAAAAYGATRAVERYSCRFGLDPGYVAPLAAAGLVVSAVDADGEPRVVELPGLRFFVATLFVPQTSSAPGAPHPLVRSFVAATASVPVETL